MSPVGFKWPMSIKFQIFGYVMPQVFWGSAQLVCTLASVPKQRADLTMQGYVSLNYRTLQWVLGAFSVVFIQTRLQALSIYGFCLSAAFLFKRSGFLLWCSSAALGALVILASWSELRMSSWEFWLSTSALACFEKPLSNWNDIYKSNSWSNAGHPVPAGIPREVWGLATLRATVYLSLDRPLACQQMAGRWTRMFGLFFWIFFFFSPLFQSPVHSQWNAMAVTA